MAERPSAEYGHDQSLFETSGFYGFARSSIRQFRLAWKLPERRAIAQKSRFAHREPNKHRQTADARERCQQISHTHTYAALGAPTASRKIYEPSTTLLLTQAPTQNIN